MISIHGHDTNFAGFIRAMRDGNWNLHLEVFAVMLPWLTIYDHTNYARWDPVYFADMRRLETTAPEVNAEFMNGNVVVKRTRRCFNQVSVDQATEWVQNAEWYHWYYKERSSQR